MKRAVLLLLGAGAIVVGTRQTAIAAPAAGCSRPAFISVSSWNLMSADTQRAACSTTPDRDESVRRVTTCSRPANTSVSDWNVMSADAQQAACRPGTTAQSEQRPVRPTNWNTMSAGEQEYWLKNGTPSPRWVTPNIWSTPAAPAATARCGRACGQVWTEEDFAASAREIERLDRQIAALRTGMGVSAPRPAGLRRAALTPPASNPNVTGTATRIGSFTYYSDSQGVTGTSTQIGSFNYYNFSNGVSGTSNQLGPFTYYNLNDSRRATTGTSTTIGSFQFHNFSNGETGTSQQIGPFTYHTFSDGTHCTTNTIGTFVYTNCN
jgi:hypothetical protein